MGIPRLTGMFIRNDITTSDESTEEKTCWGQDEYNRVCRDMADAGMTIVIPQIGVTYESKDKQVFYYKQKQFNSTDEATEQEYRQLEYCLQAAKRNGLAVYLPLQLCESLWFQAVYDKFQTESSLQFLKDSADFSIKLADEMYERFMPVFSGQILGWYQPFEIDNGNLYDMQALNAFIEHYLAPVTNHLRQLLPNGRIISSPLLYTNLTDPSKMDMAKWCTMWRNMFLRTELDTLMPQDGAGWESATSDNLASWYRPTRDMIDECNVYLKKQGRTPRIAFWNNPECYSMTGSGTMDIRRLLQNMSAVDDYVDCHISFSVHSLIPMDSRFLSGQANNKVYYDAYCTAQKLGYIPSTDVRTPTVSRTIFDTNNIRFNITKTGDALGFIMFRTINGIREKLKEISTVEGVSDYVLIDYQVIPHVTATYDIVAFDAFQNRSVASTFDITFPESVADGVADRSKALEEVNQEALSTSIPIQTLTFAEQSEGFYFQDDKAYTDRLTQHESYEPWWENRDKYAIQEGIYKDENGMAHFRIDLDDVKTVKAIGISFMQDRNASVRVPIRVRTEIDGVEFYTAEQPSIRGIDFTQPVGGNNSHKAEELWFWGFNEGIEGRQVDIYIQLEYDVFLFTNELIIL
ncbi:DUF4434 domain-containing protein [Listeria booriae]|uniref:DUF4434 domain-containing protein n=1 Tax=Listeria booriae TaxID=1552123 RepID=UPI001628B834|nr:DUF4434 domain-containing protein [Listeria booriae]MBC1892415.1 DUF4434 domain-containing protein [Listeria booriae]